MENTGRQFQKRTLTKILSSNTKKTITSPNPACIAITNCCKKKLITQYIMWPPPCVAVSPWSWKLRLKRCDLHIQAFQPFKRCHLCCQPAFNSSTILQTCFGAWNAAELLLHWKFCRLSPYTLPYLNSYLSQSVTFSTNPNDYMFRIHGSPTKITNLHLSQCQLLCWRQSDRSKPPGPRPEKNTLICPKGARCETFHNFNNSVV